MDDRRGEKPALERLPDRKMVVRALCTWKIIR